jgi:hypothetical protein
MNFIMKIITILFLCLFYSSTVFAVQVNACHCFQNRSFDAANPEKVDPYLLATTQNSFLATVFGIHKGEIVKAKMGGTSGDDLWIAYFVAAKTDTDVKSLMSARSTSGSWEAVLLKNKVSLQILGIRFSSAFAKDSSDENLSASVVDQMIIDRFGTKEAEVNKLRIKGATNKEIILSIFLSLRSSRTSFEYYDTVKAGKGTWGSNLNSLGIVAENMESEIKKMVAN